jgi:hypothetical protein
MSEIKHIEASVNIYFTREYGQFKWLKGNCELNEAKIKKIINSIKNGVNILKYAPIIVNKNMEIIDGQHRFMVSKQLKENVWYVIQDEADLSIVPAINSNSSNWSKMDYLNSYCDMGKQPYLLVRDLLDYYPGLNVSAASTMIHAGTMHNQEAKELFKDGLITSDHYDFTLQILNLLVDFKPFTQNPFSSRFVMVMCSLYNNGKYDHGHMIAKLQESKRMIEHVNTPKNIITEMESIYNHKMKSRLFIA